MLTGFSLEGWATVSLCLAPFVAIAATIVVLKLTRKKGSPRLRTILAVGTFALAFFVILASVRLPEALLVRTEEASTGAYHTLQELRGMDGVELAAVREESFYSEIGGCCCSYGRLFVIFGTTLSRPEAFHQFIQQLEAKAWVQEGQVYPTSRSLTRGDHEGLTVSYGRSPGQIWNYGRDPDYVAATSDFPNIIEIHISYILPTRQACGH